MKKQLLLFTALISAIALNAQITLVKEINNNGASSSNPAYLTVLDGKIFFSADDSNGSNTPGGEDLGKELWITDGTTDGTNFLKDIKPGSDSGNPFAYFIFNNKLYFTANDGSAELWTSDGTEAGTTKADIMPTITGEAPQRFTELNGMAYFTVGGQPGNTSAETANKLVQWDGENDAVQVADVGDGFESIFAEMVAYKDALYIYMNYSTQDASYGNELYKYSPTTDTFTLVKDIDAGTGDSSISNFTIVNDILYFEADNALWQTDGTETGTITVAAATNLAGIADLFAWNDQLFFAGDDGTNDDQLYVLNPTTNTIKNISNISGKNHDPSNYAAYNGYLYYSGEDATSTNQYLFRTNGTSIEQLDNTIKDIDEITVLNDILYFEGDNGDTGNELYSLNPTTLATESVTAEIIKVFPNPASEYIMVPQSLLKSAYVIYDISGKSVSGGIISSEKIDLDLNSGLYILQVQTNLNTISKKIIVK
ncbi:T9SS type A sorting domain-containing protein [Polaribacter sp. HaHaR_3_91]|uniref:T9SS type A sorting domain-containing protein n=1 Tax=Polaribacter sp. HaHaR_3_91 TaxID=2745561 RepID=UPI001C4E8E54|nr:T9SS type A sorting domain-containing protein [Polaribacter sp. HaHaR_3_91]QXP63364.1 T9SS type A sorting domain-containing protein [Polaribacter sp. HaHaR_3_91]